MEEMAGNIVEHGFIKDKKHHSADIRVVHKDDTIILRIRDNCIAFDPAERLRVMEADKNGKNVGIKLVYAIATEVTYQNLLGLNVLTMRI
jgi:anti-sigma regulatory factor (Ser/Thr protein kinase)